MNGPTELSLGLAFVFVIAGLAMLVGGGESLVSGAARLARLYGMSPLMIGLTVVAFGTSVPELFVSLTAALQGYPDIMIGNIVGSNIANIGLILGICAMIANLRLTLQEVWTELLLVIAGSVLFMFCSSVGLFPRYIGILFILTIISYTVLSYRGRTKSPRDPTGTDGDIPAGSSPLLPFVLIITGLVLLAAGSDIFIRGAASAARYFGISELVIGLTLAAVGTSLPELASSISALRRREAGMLIGNVIGSNMFNLLMVLGLTGTIKPFSLSPELLQRDLPVMLAFTLALVAALRHSGGTRRWHGLVFFLGYGIYCIFLL